MDFTLSAEQRSLQGLCRDLARDFASRAARHDAENSAPVENYAALRSAELFGLLVPKSLGGMEVGMLGYALAMEELAQGCASTALSFNMHCAAAYIITATAFYTPAIRARVARMIIDERRLFANLISEAGTTNLLYSTRASGMQATRVDGGYRLNGKKAFTSMFAAADCALICVHPAHVENPESVIMVVVPTDAPGVVIERVWDTLGMRATQSDNVEFKDCFVPDELAFDTPVVPSIGEFLRTHESLINLPYTAVYLGVGLAALAHAKATALGRLAKGYSQPMAYHPDVRRRIAKMHAELEAARWLTRHAAWLADTEGQTPATQAAMFRAKYMVGEAVTAATRSALELGGAHGLFKGIATERLFRDGATASIQQPSSDVCLAQLSILELGLDADAVVPPLPRAT
ncbi:MAG: acyl-CoA/acyl-ACP dehydrogenase [Proteobacteria bacterium]|nr:acyl-CoA/acyl-ACP dehydrogenase [Pseudomonadota bacterium]